MRLQILDDRGRPLELGCSRVLILAVVDEAYFARGLDSLGVSRVEVARGRAPTVGQFAFAPRV